MLLKVGNRTPPRPKRLLGDEYTWESQFPSGEYTGSLRLPVVNTLGNLDYL
jgi:hypothetical protein